MLLTSLLLAACPAAPPLAVPTACLAARPALPAADDVFDERLEAAGDDPVKLWDLVLWCEDTDRVKEAGTTLRKLIRVDPDHVKAREKLGHVRYDGQWFTSDKKLETYKKKETERLAKERGWVKHDGEWVDPADIPFLEQGLVRGPAGQWMTRDDLEKLEQGWVRQDLVWVAPDELEQLEAGLWKCGDQWLELDAANRYHARPEQAWEIPSDHVVLRTTCRREVALVAIDHMERGFPDLARIFGRSPAARVEVFLASDSPELGGMCTEGYRGHPPIETRGLIESMRSLFAESWYDPQGERWRGAGASWWDASNEAGNKFGVHDARMALGLAFVEALDPSPKAVEKLLKRKGPYDGYAQEYYAEKALPAWLRWGAACYVSRFYPDQVGAGGDPWWTRKWSVQNLAGRGGLPSFLKTVFEMEMTGREQDGRMVLSAGLLVAFLLDGECGPVREAHAELKAALRSGEDTGKILDKLRKAIEKHEKDLRAFGGL